jgi:hypothetical protein
MEHNQYIQAGDSQIVDPVLKLMEDVKTRKLKVRIPNLEDMIPSLYNDRTIKKNVLTEIIVGDTSPTLDKPIRWPRVLQNLRSPEFPTAQQKIILNRLEAVPAYVVATDNQEIVMASPREGQYNSFFDWLYIKYYNMCVWTEDDGPISIALFFLNKEDAHLYLQEVGKKEPKSTQKIGLHVQLTSLDTFYTLNKTSSPGTQAKLIPDLEEIYKVVSDYLPKKLHEVNPKQKCNKTSYQGNPVYIIKPMAIPPRYSKKSIKLLKPALKALNSPWYKTKPVRSQRVIKDYSIDEYGFPSISSDYGTNVFFKLEDAYLAWDKLCEDNKAMNLPLVPIIEVYNLESYLLDLECSDLDVVGDNYFFATRSSLAHLRQELDIIDNTDEPTLKEKVNQFISNSSKKLVQFSKGMLWVFTSEALPTEDNDW